MNVAPQAVSSLLTVGFAILPSGARTTLSFSSPELSQARTVQSGSYRQRKSPSDLLPETDPFQAASSLVSASSAIRSSGAGTSLSCGLSSEPTTSDFLRVLTLTSVKDAGGVHEDERQDKHYGKIWRCPNCR